MHVEQLSKLKSHFVTKAIGDDLVLVPLTNNVVQMTEIFTLNETARFIWEHSDVVEDIDQMATLITNAFEIDYETAYGDILSFLEKTSTILNPKSSL